MRKTLLAIAFLFCSILQAQMTINNTLLTPKQLVENVLVNPSVIPFNIKFNGVAQATLSPANDQAAKWQTNFTSGILGMGSNQQGILLTTGNAQVANGPNNSGSKTQAPAIPTEGDADLALLSGFIIRNVAVLEFDFVATQVTLNFDYVFASEEYPEYANSAFNDVFGFFLSGPGITGPYMSGTAKNIALLPTTQTGDYGVTINNVNPVDNTLYYTGNGTGTTPSLNPDLQYDGLTINLTATSTLQIGGTYHIKFAIANVADNAFDSGVFIKNFTNNSSDKIKLVAFVDANNNGIKDTNETNFGYGSYSYQQNNIGNITSVSSSNGDYTLYDNNSANTYDFSYQINPEIATYYAATATNYNDINIPVGGGTQTLYFPVTITQNYNDISVTIVPVNAPRPGLTYTNKIVYKNMGIVATSGTITFTKPALTTITTIGQTETVTTPTGFTYDYTNLLPYETRTFNVTMSVPTIPTVNIGNILTDSASITAPASDINLANNAFTNSQIVVGSYDPNDKMEAHGEKILFSSFSANEYLTYTIRFQNTGTANAINVRLEDVLHPKLNPASIRMVSASHNYVMTRVNNAITWKFDDIQLPYASLNEALSNGYVTFQIKLLPGFAVGDIIPNHADIYFDMNPAIITNTFNTEFVATLKTVTFNAENILIYPNPSSDVIKIHLENTMENLESVVLYDVVGKTVLKSENIDSNQSTINVSNLAKGLYLVEIITENKLKMTKKLIIK